MVKKKICCIKIFKHLIMNINTIFVCVCVCIQDNGYFPFIFKHSDKKIELAQVIIKHLIHFAHYSPSILFHNFHNTQYRG